MYYVKTAVSTDIFCQCHVRSGTTSARPNFSPSHWLNGLWKQGKWFPSDNRRCISLRHSSPFTIHPANGNNSIYHRGRHPQNNGNTGGDCDWFKLDLFFRNPGQEKKPAKWHQFMAFLPRKKHATLSLRIDCTSQRVYQYACLYACKPHFR